MSNNEVINEYLIWKEVKAGNIFLISSTTPALACRTEEYHEIFTKDSKYLGQVLNWVHLNTKLNYHTVNNEVRWDSTILYIF
jgi:hypothetical protein